MMFYYLNINFHGQTVKDEGTKTETYECNVTFIQIS